MSSISLLTGPTYTLTSCEPRRMAFSFFSLKVQNVLIFFARQNFKRLTKLINNHFFFFYIAVTFLMQCVANVHTALYLSQESGS